MNTIFGLDTETTKESYKKGSLMSIQVYSPEKNNSVVFTRIPGTENWEIYLVNSEKVLEDQISKPPRDLSIKVDVCSLGTHLESLIKKRKEVYTTKAVKEFFQKKQMKFVTHNGYFDHYVLLRDLGISVDIVADTYIMAIMIPSRVNDLSNLQDLMQRHFDRNYDKARYGEWEDFDWSRGVYSTSQILYGSQDAMATYILYQELLKKYGSAKQDFFGEIYKMELSLIPIFSEMRMKGILVDKKRFQDSLESFKKESEEKIRNLYALRGKPFKINSAAEVAKWLYEERGNVCPIFSRKTRKPSASAKALDMLDDPVVKDLRDARESDSIYRALEALNQSDLPEDLGKYTLWHPEFKPLSHTRGSRIYTCIEENQRVRMKDGTERPIKEVQEGDVVRSFTQFSVVNKVLDRGEKEVYEIEMEDGKKLICTGDHKVGVMEEGKLIWKEVLTLKDMDEIVVLTDIK